MRATPIRASSARAQYAAFARAVNLRPGDVPGFAGRPHHREGGDGDGAMLRVCHIAAPTSGTAAEFSSPSFAAGPARYREQANSDVEIERSAGAIHTAVATVQRAFSSSRTRDCLATQYRKEFVRSATPTRSHRGFRTRLMNVEVQVKPFGAQRPAGAEASGAVAIGVRAVFVVARHGREADFPVSLVAAARYFTRGRAMVTLSTWAFNTQFPPQLESRLISLLASRANVASGEYPAIGA